MQNAGINFDLKFAVNVPDCKKMLNASRKKTALYIQIIWILKLSLRLGVSCTTAKIM